MHWSIPTHIIAPYVARNGIRRMNGERIKASNVDSVRELVAFVWWTILEYVYEEFSGLSWPLAHSAVIAHRIPCHSGPCQLLVSSACRLLCTCSDAPCNSGPWHLCACLYLHGPYTFRSVCHIYSVHCMICRAPGAGQPKCAAQLARTALTCECTMSLGRSSVGITIPQSLHS